MQIRTGSLLIANPAYAPREKKGKVVYITESTDYSTMGITLNAAEAYSLSNLLKQRGLDWPLTTFVSMGGEYSPNCMIMLHTNEWFSSNTMSVSNNLSISSDDFMLEKLSDGNTPDWYRLFMGTSGWSPQELESDLRGSKPKWLLLPKPSEPLIQSKPTSIWYHAIEELSTDVFNSYF